MCGIKTNMEFNSFASELGISFYHFPQCFTYYISLPVYIKKRKKKKQELLLSLSQGFQFPAAKGNPVTSSCRDTWISLSHTHAFSYFNTVSYIF